MNKILLHILGLYVLLNFFKYLAKIFCTKSGQKVNRQPSETEYFYSQPSNERAEISRRISPISLKRSRP